jgi:acyl-homoserine lactone acylase PvdQ
VFNYHFFKEKFSMLLKITAGGVPAGSYHAIFKNAEAVTNDYGPGLRWIFEVVGGPHAGQTASRTTTQSPTTQNSCGKLLSGITGKPLSIGVEFELSAYIGKAYLIVVGEGKTGATRVEAVTQLPTA